MGESPNPDWMNQWQALARQYANAWQGAAHGAAGVQPPPATPMQGFEQWSRLLAAGTGGQGETIDRLIDSTKSYATYMQSLLAAATANTQGGNVPWSNAFAQGFADPASGAPLFEHPAVRAWREMAGQGNTGFAPFMDALRTPPTADLSELKAWLNLPAFGSARERQEQLQKTALSAVDYQEQMNRYNALMLKASQSGFALFEGKLAEREQPGRQIESLRALYDLWVDAAEEGYAEVALSEEFREVYGALVNAQMRVRAQVQQEVERIGTELGMPTRSEVDSIGERVQALRREVRALGTDGLAGKVAALREELAALTVGGKRTRRSIAVVDEAVAEPPRKVASTSKPAPMARTVPTAAHARKSARGSKTAQARKKLQAARKQAPKRVQAPKRARAPTKATRTASPKKFVQRATVASAAHASGARNFASRIAKFANASLGASRAHAHEPDKRAKSRSAKAR